MTNNFNVVEFREVDISDPYSKKYLDNWSRPYEYYYAINFIETHKTENMTVHNTACGGHNRVHNIFINELNKLCKCVHSDINKRKGIGYLDLTKNYAHLKNYFDIVLNISTLEHIDEEKQLIAFENLYDQVKTGGFLLVTFDYPPMRLEKMENYLGFECVMAENALSGRNSIAPDVRKDRQHSIIELIIKK